MKIIEPGYKILTSKDEIIVMPRRIEAIGRLCYKSEERIEDGSADKFVRKLVESGHEAMIEHASISVKFIVDRGVSHEIVRHRLSSFAQESTRYCNYAKDKFGNEITVIKPCFWEKGSDKYQSWAGLMRAAESHYFELLQLGATPQETRSVLPNSLKTEIVMTANLREWRHFLKIRTPKEAHPQMREVTRPLLREFKELLPAIFGDLPEYDD